MPAAAHLVLSFLAYCILGWLVEGAVRLASERRLVNPGFLAGPFVPIYGVGALGILLLTAEVRGYPLAVFAIGVGVGTVVEYVGHLLLQRVLGLVLWDYSNHHCNLQGRVCLLNSVAFGAAALAVVYLIHPTLTAGFDLLDPLLAVALASAGTTVLVVDWIRSMTDVLRVRPEIQSMQGSLTQLRHRIDAQLADLGGQYDRRHARLLRNSRRALTRLEAAFPQARTVLRLVIPPGPTNQNPDQLDNPETVRQHQGDHDPEHTRLLLRRH